MIAPLFSWLKRSRGETPSSAPGAKAAADRRRGAEVGQEAGDAGGADPTDAVRDLPSGREAGRREVRAVATLRDTVFVDREQAALHTQLARAPRDAGALFGLLQWHARRGERAEVEAFAHILWDETDAEGGLWLRAAALGRGIDPNNPLYSDDPFAALAEHAAARGRPNSAASATPGDSRTGQWQTLDLNLPDLSDAASLHGALASTTPGDEQIADGSVRSRGDGHPGPAGSGGINWLSAQTASLPSEIRGLSLDLDDDTPWTEPAETPPGKPIERLTDKLSEKPVRFYRPVRAPGRKQRGRKKPGK